MCVCACVCVCVFMCVCVCLLCTHCLLNSLHPPTARITLPMSTLSGTTKFKVGNLELDSDDTRRARVLYDYDANGSDELSVSRDQVTVGYTPRYNVHFFTRTHTHSHICTHIYMQEIEITPIPNNDEYVMAKSEGKYGKIPSTYVEKL